MFRSSFLLSLLSSALSDDIHRKRGQKVDFDYSYCQHSEDSSHLPCELNWDHVPNSNCGDPNQSPIDIVTSGDLQEVHETMTLAPHSCPSAELISIEENGHSWEVFVSEECRDPEAEGYQTGANIVTWKGVDYSFVQMHFHSPSEHMLNGEHFDSEVHFVHTDIDGNRLVLGTFLKAEEDVEPNEFLEQFWKLGFHNTSIFGESFSPYEFIPLTSEFYHYTGSTTTPPCFPNVLWFVRTSYAIMSKHELEVFQEALAEMAQTREAGYNNRPVQPLGSRSIKMVHLGTNAGATLSVSVVLSLCVSLVTYMLL